MRERSEFANDLWAGLATDCDHCREIKSRYRTGRGIWFAVIEAIRTHPGEITLKRMSSRSKSAKGKGRPPRQREELLKENAKDFDEYTSIEARLYCELEWEPPEDRE